MRGLRFPLENTCVPAISEKVDLRTEEVVTIAFAGVLMMSVRALGSIRETILHSSTIGVDNDSQSKD